MLTTTGFYHENHDGAYPVPFLENLFSTAPQDSFIEIRAIRSGFSFRRSYRRRGDGAIPPVPYLGERNIYFGVLPRSRKGGRAADVATGTCVWLDLDQPKMLDWVLRPTMVVDTSPGKCQVYWVLDKPVEDLDHIEEINRRLAQYHGGDMASTDRARVLRLPGSPNFKYPDLPRSLVRELIPNLRYPLEALEGGLPDLVPGNARQPRRHTKSSPGSRKQYVPKTEISPGCPDPEQREFLRLWGELGLELAAGDRLYPCCFHDDSDPSLHIDRERMLWFCFGNCSEEASLGGGLVQLRELVKKL